MRFNKIKKGIALVGVVAMMAMTLAGCGEEKVSHSDLNPDEVVLTVGDQEVKMSEAFFLLKWQQANYQNMIAYNTNAGDEWYKQDLFGTGESFQDYFKDYYVDLMTRICLAREKAVEMGVELTADEKSEIETAVEAYMEKNVQSARDAMMADEEVVRQVLTDYKLLEKVTATAIADVDTNITDEELKDEAFTRTYSYVYVSFETEDEEGNYTLMSAAEQEDLYNQLAAIRAETLDTGDFDAAVENAGLSVSSHEYHPGDTKSEDTLYEINNHMDKYKIGEVSEVLPLDSTGAMIAYLAGDNTSKLGDEEVLTEARETIMYEREVEFFKNCINEWKADKNVELNEELWAKVTMEEPLAAVAK